MSKPRSHDLFLLVFLRRVRLHLDIERFPPLELVHIIAPLGATFLRQRSTLRKLASKRPRVESSLGAPVGG